MESKFFKDYFNNKDYTVCKGDQFATKKKRFSFFFSKARLPSLNFANAVNVNFLFNLMFYIEYN